jgi:hypothetical protein
MIQDQPWERFMEFPDAVSAAAAVAYFEQNGVPSRIEPASTGVDLSPIAYVLVQGQLAHRARWLWAQQSDITESELNFLATGKFDDNDTGQ